jgi:hypothetical protein
MAVGDNVPPERTIFRAIRKKDLNPDNSINEIAFLLKPAHDEFVDEIYLSIGVDPAGAVVGLQRIRHVAAVCVADLIALGLTVVEDNDPHKVQVAGMPLVTVDQIGAMKFAKDIRSKAALEPYP